MGACGTRGHGPTAQWLLLPFYTPKGAWPLRLPQPIHLAQDRGTVHTPPKHPRDIWARVADGPPPSNTAHPTTAPTRPRRQQPRTPAPTPELNATQKWRAPLWATALPPEPGPRRKTQPRPATPAPKPGLTSPSAFQQNIGTRKMTQERNVPYTQPSRQPNAGEATDAQTPTPPAACNRNALSAL